jgi:urease
VEAAKNCRNISKRDMKFNDVMPKMKVDPERYVSASLILSESRLKPKRPLRQMANSAKQSPLKYYL